MNQNKVVLFDICGTLFFSNTSFDFLDSIIKVKSYKYFRYFSRTLLARIVNKIFISIFNKDLIRSIAVHYIKGLNKIELKAYANDFYDNFLYSNKIKESFDKIEYYRKLPDTIVILASATFDFIAETVAEKLNIPFYFGSELSYDSNDVFEGCIKKDRLGHKYQAVLDMGIKPPFDKVITDNITDLDIINKSKSVDLIIYPWTEKKWLKKKKLVVAIIENVTKYEY